MPSVRSSDLRLAAFGIFILGAAAVAGPARATDLTELRERLVALPGNGPIRAQIEVRVEVATENREPPAATTASASVAADANGVRISFPRAVLDEVAQRAEAPRTESDGETPPEAIEQLAGPTVDRLLDFADEIDSWLARSTVIESDGNQLRLDIEPIPQEGLVKVEVLTLELTLQDGVPRIARTRRVSRGGMLFLKVTHEESVEHELEIAGDRLVVTRRTQTMDVSGMGLSFRQFAEIVLTVERPPTPAAATGPR